MIQKSFDTAKKQEIAVLVAVQEQGVRDEELKEYTDELAFLAETCGAKVVYTFTQKLTKIHPRSYVGEGKLKEIVDFVTANEIDIVIFDDELSPSQIRNLENDVKCKILDRSNLILDIFAKHAKTAQAKTQVELAQNQYLLPRLTRMWTHLQKQKGGVGMRGPGEREIETDRRAIRTRISLLSDKLEDIERIAFNQRKNRQTERRIALVGYTNVGKSTIMNLLSKSDVLAENKLFATLDATVRKVYIDGHQFLLSDTVGFIRKLPHQLVECFKSTLDEVREADILLHVVDVSHPNFEEQVAVVDQTLLEIGAADKPRIMIFNKIDLIKPQEEETIEEAILYLGHQNRKSRKIKIHFNQDVE
ncbi:MAG: GTPase HflX [Bacteroidetes bacterium]|nr:GTPase HflX [Bacteroidota bacterium]